MMMLAHQLYRVEYVSGAHQLACLLSGCTAFRWYVQTRKAPGSLAEWYIVTTDASTNRDQIVQSFTRWEAGQRLPEEN